MSYITLNSNKLKYNYHYLDQLFAEHHIEWAVVAKLLCGNETFLECLLEFSDKEICDSRLTNLKHIKKISPKTQTVYISNFTLVPKDKVEMKLDNFMIYL